MSEALEACWARVQDKLRREFGEAAWNSWLKPLTLCDIREDEARIAVPTRFLKDWVATHYVERIRSLLQGEDSKINAVDLIVVPGLGGFVGNQPMAHDDADASMSGSSQSSDEAREDDLDGISAPLDSRFTFENFVVGKPNEFAFAAAKHVAETDSAPTRNPLFLYGGVGLGKTHLMHAIAWSIRQNRPERRVLYLSAEKFMYQFVRALSSSRTVEFKDLFRSVDVLMVDDIQFISGKNHTQEEFFHTFNSLIDSNKQIVLSADKSPSDLEGIRERLRSRMAWGLVADIHPTTYELRLGILQSKSAKSRVPVSDKVLEFLAHNISSNIRELEGALNRIVAHAELVGRPITLETAEEMLSDLLRANNRQVTIADIQKKVAEHFNIKVTDMSSGRKSRAVSRPRQVAMFLSKELTPSSLPEIGRQFGGRDHTTVMYAVKTIKRLIHEDRALSDDIELLRRTLS